MWASPLYYLLYEKVARCGHHRREHCREYRESVYGAKGKAWRVRIARGYFGRARAEGYELSEEELDQIAGGTPVWVVTNMWTCKKCGGKFKYLETDRDYKRYQCTKCGQLYNWK